MGGNRDLCRHGQSGVAGIGRSAGGDTGAAKNLTMHVNCICVVGDRTT